MPYRLCLDRGLGCQQYGTGTRCTVCERARQQRRGSSTARGYDHGHEAERARQLAEAMDSAQRGDPWPCPRCGQPIRPGQPVDLGHIVALARGGDPAARRLEHATCNRAAGAD
jgi:hypothetical protein